MRPEADLQVQVARRRAVEAGAALAGQPQVLALAHAGRNGHVQRALAQHHMALRVQGRHLQADAAAGAAVGVGQVDRHLGMVVLRARRRLAARLPAAPAEQGLEEVAVVAGAEAARTAEGFFAAAEFVAAVPARRRLLVTRLPALADIVVGLVEPLLGSATTEVAEPVELDEAPGFVTAEGSPEPPEHAASPASPAR